MRIKVMMLACCVLFAACSTQQDAADSMHASGDGMSSPEVSFQMQQLQRLVVLAAGLAALPGGEGKAQSANLLRRAMSGPEMNAMHHGGGGMNPGMQHTHDLGDAVFELLALDAATQEDTKWRSRLALAASASALVLDDHVSGSRTGQFEAEQGRALWQQLAEKQLQTPLPTRTAYARAAATLIEALQGL
ncbi:MAG: hypothetical protein Q9M30_10720 [Mariprofundaceae bacterium]|nr:hypothetical protein [Mariprofundaceae bacterium]